MANAKCSKKVAEDFSGVTFSFSNGEVLDISVSELPASIVGQLICHGLSQKIGDSYAGAKTVEEALENASEMAQRLLKGEWGTVRSEGTSKARISQLSLALQRATGKTEEEVLALLDTLSNEQKTALRKHPQIAPHIAQIKIEQEQEKLKELEAKASEGPSLVDILSGAAALQPAEEAGENSEDEAEEAGDHLLS